MKIIKIKNNHFRVPISGHIIWETHNDGKKYPGVFVLGKYYKKHNKVHIAIYPFAWRGYTEDPIIPCIKLYAEKQMMYCEDEKEFNRIMKVYIKDKNIQCECKSYSTHVLSLEEKSLIYNTIHNVIYFKTRFRSLLQIYNKYGATPYAIVYLNNTFPLYLYTRKMHDMFYTKQKIKYIMLDFDSYDEGRPWL